LITTSTRPNLAIAASKALRIEAALVRSTACSRVLALVDSVGSGMRDGVRERATMRWAGCAERMEASREAPMPVEVPVTVGKN
jgi:hypothetical protein